MVPVPRPMPLKNRIRHAVLAKFAPEAILGPEIEYSKRHNCPRQATRLQRPAGRGVGGAGLDRVSALGGQARRCRWVSPQGRGVHAARLQTHLTTSCMAPRPSKRSATSSAIGRCCRCLSDLASSGRSAGQAWRLKAPRMRGSAEIVRQLTIASLRDPNSVLDGFPDEVDLTLRLTRRAQAARAPGSPHSRRGPVRWPAAGDTRPTPRARWSPQRPGNGWHAGNSTASRSALASGRPCLW